MDSFESLPNGRLLYLRVIGRCLNNPETYSAIISYDSFNFGSFILCYRTVLSLGLKYIQQFHALIFFAKPTNCPNRWEVPMTPIPHRPHLRQATATADPPGADSEAGVGCRIQHLPH